MPGQIDNLVKLWYLLLALGLASTCVFFGLMVSNKYLGFIPIYLLMYYWTQCHCKPKQYLAPAWPEFCQQNLFNFNFNVPCVCKVTFNYIPNPYELISKVSEPLLNGIHTDTHTDIAVYIYIHVLLYFYTDRLYFCIHNCALLCNCILRTHTYSHTICLNKLG